MKSDLEKLGSINYPFLTIVQKLHPFLNIPKNQKDSNTIEARTISLSFNT